MRNEFRGLWRDRKNVVDVPIQGVCRNAGGSSQIDLQEMQKQPVAAEDLPFRDSKLRDKLLVMLVGRHTDF